MDRGSTLSGVPIHRSRVGVNSTPSTVRTAPAKKANTTVVWMARSDPSRSRAPQYREITTPAPRQSPWKNPISRWHMLPEELTAARAASPHTFPTTRESTIL